MAQDYVCVGVEGLLKGAVYYASNVVEWDGPKATMVMGGGVHRIPGGRLVTQLTEGSAKAVMKDGKRSRSIRSGSISNSRRIEAARYSATAHADPIGVVKDR